MDFHVLVRGYAWQSTAFVCRCLLQVLADQEILLVLPPAICMYWKDLQVDIQSVCPRYEHTYHGHQVSEPDSNLVLCFRGRNATIVTQDLHDITRA